MRRMSAVAEFPRSTKAEVFALLAEGLKAGATVITPNRRLALALTHDFDDSQTRHGLAVWESADILPFATFVERAYEDARSVARLRQPIVVEHLPDDALENSHCHKVRHPIARGRIASGNRRSR